MATEHPSQQTSAAWTGRLAVILIVGFVVLVLVLMFLAARGPGS